MSYTGTTPKDLNTSTPDGATEYANILDDAIREVKSVFKNCQSVTTITTDTTLDATHFVVHLNKATAIAATLPAASSVSSAAYTKEYIIRNINSGTGTVTGTVILSGTSTVNPTLTQGEEMHLWGNGTSWYGVKISIWKADFYDHGSQATNYSLDMSLARAHFVEFSGTATLTISSSYSNDTAIISIKNGNNAITLSGIDTDSPTLTTASTKQDIIALVKSFGKITCVGADLNVATS